MLQYYFYIFQLLIFVVAKKISLFIKKLIIISFVNFFIVGCYQNINKMHCIKFKIPKKVGDYIWIKKFTREYSTKFENNFKGDDPILSCELNYQCLKLGCVINKEVMCDIREEDINYLLHTLVESARNNEAYDDSINDVLTRLYIINYSEQWGNCVSKNSKDIPIVLDDATGNFTIDSTAKESAILFSLFEMKEEWKEEFGKK